MPPYAKIFRLGGGSEPKSVVAEEEAVEQAPSKASDPDLLAIIAAKDKRIQELEEKLEKQNAFVEAVLSLAEKHKTVSQGGKLRRRVSWCASVDEQEVKKERNFMAEISVDDLSSDDDDLSVLSDDEPVPRKLEPKLSEPQAAAASAAEPPKKVIATKQALAKPRKKPSPHVQVIINRLRDDSDSVSV